MKKSYLSLGLLLGALSINIAFANTASSAAHTASTATNLELSKQTIAVTKSQTKVTIILNANGTTGYQWFLKNSPSDLLETVSYHYYAPASQIIGAGGRAVFTFKLKPAAFKVPYIIPIDLVYARPSDITKGETRTFYIVTY